ncbi:hypothetical protein [Saccharothrix syringae]|uniref:Uncharacterized protein n=1 Tax=Saccharothrix syringae TaxID=103733 RepID=A0A5Q0GSZ4_SACSY|nr:hypothetical protein [Saccharothrix syringae]QFZ17108.1 hypothetical protein EKG83_06180 [Saccharothrix syringae]
MTTALDVRRLFNVTQETRYRFNGWYRGRGRVVEQVMAHEADAVLRVTAEEVEAACRSAPAPSPAEVPGVRGWRPDVPFTVVAHHVVEASGRLPDWPAFRGSCASDERAREMLWTPAREVVAGAGRAARVALRDRVVRDYLAFLRDTYVLAVLRGHGLDVRVHPLADVVFEVDAWVDRLVLNPRGGPQRSADLLVHAMPPFFFADLGITRFTRVGPVPLPARDQLDRAARRLRDVLHPG